MEVCFAALTDEIKALKFTIFTFEVQLYYHSRDMTLFHYHYTAMVRNQRQLLTCEI